MGLVNERRKLAPEAIEQVKTGRIFSGRQAAAMKLVDALGDESSARDWMEANRDVPKALRVADWEPENSSRYSLLRLGSMLLNAVMGGLFDESLAFLDERSSLAAQKLDGLISVWQLPKVQ
jgi:protease-4